MRRRLATALCAVLCAGSTRLPAQEVSLLLAGTHARYADSLSGSAGVAGIRLRSLGRLRAVEAQATLSQFATGEWAAQITGQATAFRPLGPRLAVGFAGGGTVSDFEGGSWSGVAAGGPMLALTGDGYLLSIGVSAGGVRSIDEVGRALATASARATVTAGAPLRVDLGVLQTIAQDSVAYADFTAGATWERGAVRVGVSAGARAGDLADDPWVQGRLEYAASPVARLEAAAGRYPRDLVGFTDGVFVQAGLRLTAGSATGARPAAALPRATLVSPGRVRVTVRYARAVTSLAIAGAFSEWNPVPLRRRGNAEWTVEIELPPGIHQFALIADGVWTLPDGAPGIDDGFGGKVAVLVVDYTP